MNELEKLEQKKKNFEKYGQVVKPKIVQLQEMIAQINQKSTV